MKAIEQFEQLSGIRLTKKKHFEILMMLMCIELVLAFSYLGFIQIAPLSVTTLHIFVIVAAMFFGPWDASAVALVFSITSMWTATVTSIEPGDIIFSPLLSGKPLESIIMAVGARIAFAIIAGYSFRWYLAHEWNHKVGWGVSLISVLSTLIHSLLVYACMVVFFGAAETETSDSFSRALVLNNLILYGTTVAVVFLNFSIIRLSQTKQFFRNISLIENETKERRSILIIVVYLLIVVFAVFIALHFMSRLGMFIKKHGENVNEEYISWTYSLLLQFIIGFVGVFGFLFLFMRWIQEYYSALVLNANILAKDNAVTASKAKTDFLFNMSHDIRTPMNAIMGFTNIAIKNIDNKERVIDSLTKTQEAGELLLSLINDILDMSRIESGKIKLDENEGDAFLSFVNIESTMQELARAKNIRLSFEFGNIENRYVYADFSLCMRVFVNIITNAIKYTDEGGFVKVRCEQIGLKDGYAILKYTFEDNGIGMSEDFQKRVFDEFSREETATVSGIQGTGLGLAVCKSFVSVMGGTIECKSKQGEGSTFTVILPFRIQEGQHAYIDPRMGQLVPEVTDQKADEKRIDFSGKRVLLVEDNELNREIAEDILLDEGMLVETASDGSIAVKKMNEMGPCYYDFVLMDIQMPIMNGYEATKLIREMYPRARIPIIALSANAFEEDKVASLTAGMNDHVAKPIKAEVLKATLARFLN